MKVSDRMTFGPRPAPRRIPVLLVTMGALSGLVFCCLAKQIATATRGLATPSSTDVSVASEPTEDAYQLFNDRVLRLESRVRAMESELLQLRVLAVRQPGDPPPSSRNDDSSAAESPAPDRAEALNLLIGETPTAMGHRAVESGIASEIARVLHDTAKVAQIACAKNFCRIILERSGDAASEVEIHALTEEVPSLQHETVFKYEQHGNIRRTIMYVARDGSSLPLPGTGRPSEL